MTSMKVCCAALLLSALPVGAMAAEVNIYSARQEALIKPQLDAFTSESGIRVNLVSPGFVAGPRLDWVMEAQAAGRGIDPGQVRLEFESEAALRRLTGPEDVAGVTVFLASDQAAGISGADINVSSGAVMY